MTTFNKTSALIRLCNNIGLVIEKVTGVACVVFLGGMVVVVAAGVFFRFIINNPLQWSEELARFLMLWTGFAAMNISMRRDNHIKINVIRKFLPSWLQIILDYIVYLLIGFFLLLLMIKGYNMSVSTRMTALALPVSMTWIYASVPIGAALTLVQLSLNFIKTLLSDTNKIRRKKNN